MKTTISVITPVYNEINTLETNITRIEKALHMYDYEILIVDDNSPDGSGKIADKLSTQNPRINVLHRREKTGLGTAYKDGFFHTSGELIISMDSDLSHDPFYLPTMIKQAEKADIVIGSRLCDGGSIVGRDYWRDVLSYLANYTIHLITGKPIYDWTSGMRVYTRVAWESIMPQVHCDKWDFQFESLYKAVMKGFTVSELPITFYERADGASKFSLTEAFWFFKSFIKIILGLK